MSKRIAISKIILEKLYLNEKLSTYKIAEKFNCDPSVIQRRLKEYKTTIRKPKEKINISKSQLYNLYINKKYSTQAISKILGISSCSVYHKLKEAGITIRQKKIVDITKTRLKQLYVNKNYSCLEIAQKFNCNAVTIFNKLRHYSIKTRNPSKANTIYPKKKFQGNDKLRAYMIGFRLGDLNVKAKDDNSTIMVKSCTTKDAQVELIKKIYGNYGHFKCNFNGQFYNIYCNLDSSFNFLLKKEDKIEDWIFKSNKNFFSFLGGYSDAEGNFGVYQNRARFRVGSYDKNILGQIADKLNSLGIKAHFNLEGKAIKGKHNQDFYRVSINEKQALLNFIKLVKSSIKHAKRYKDLLLCEENILERNKNR